MNLSPISIAIARTYGLAHPPRPIWLGDSVVLRAFLRNGGRIRSLRH